IELNIAGSGDVLGSEMRGNEVEVNIAGSGDVAVRAQETLKVGIAGSGNI
ncbi:GIN domain-containing protein, partial [Aeromonas veronii]